jgi:hypothetical protein
MNKKRKIILAVLACFGAVVLLVGVVVIIFMRSEVDPHIKSKLEKMHAEGKLSDSEWREMMADNKVTKFELLDLMFGK